MGWKVTGVRMNSLTKETNAAESSASGAGKFGGILFPDVYSRKDSHTPQELRSLAHATQSMVRLSPSVFSCGNKRETAIRPSPPAVNLKPTT